MILDRLIRVYIKKVKVQQFTSDSGFLDAAGTTKGTRSLHSEGVVNEWTRPSRSQGAKDFGKRAREGLGRNGLAKLQLPCQVG